MNGAVFLPLMQMSVSTTMLSLVICKRQDFIQRLVFFPDHGKCIQSIARETWAKSQPLLVKPHTAGMRKGTQQAPESQHPGKFQCSVMAREDQPLQTLMLYVADLQSSSVWQRGKSAREEWATWQKESMCSSFGSWKHSNSALALATDMHPSHKSTSEGGGKARKPSRYLHREVPKVQQGEDRVSEGNRLSGLSCLRCISKIPSRKICKLWHQTKWQCKRQASKEEILWGLKPHQLDKSIFQRVVVWRDSIILWQEAKLLHEFPSCSLSTHPQVQSAILQDTEHHLGSPAEGDLNTGKIPLLRCCGHDAWFKTAELNGRLYAEHF